MKVISFVSRMLNYLGMTSVMLLMALTVGDVLMRLFFNRPIPGAAELAAMVMVLLVLSMAWCAIKGQHIVADFLMNRFSSRIQAIVGCITFLLSLGIYGIITWRSFLSALWDLKYQYVVSIQVPMPRFIFWDFYVLGYAMLCVVIVTILIASVKVAITGKAVTKETRIDKEREVTIE
jgi:TRAP-type C4-dicarboxylate transport system permease small subunit